MGTAPYGIGVEIGRDLADTNPPGADGMPYGGCNEIFFYIIPTLFRIDCSILINIFEYIKQNIKLLFFERFGNRRCILKLS